MRKVLKSLLVLALTVGIGVSATGAYFSSTVLAEDNVISTGTLLMAVDTSDPELDGGLTPTWGTHAWNVVQEAADGDMVVSGKKFVAWDNVAPGDTYSYYVGIRNMGTIDAEVRSMATGEWVDGPRLVGDDSCPLPADANASLVQVSNVHQFASGNCNGETGCENIYYSLTNAGWTNVSGLSAANAMFDPDDGYYYGNVGGSGQEEGTHYLMGEDEFAIYRVDVELDPLTGNCYQGATYNFDLAVQGKQEADPLW